jgi:hypothetical protein
MELREFVTETLMAIQDGIAEAIRRAVEKQSTEKHFTGIINPVWEGEDDWKAHTQTIEFDVAVTESDKTSAGGKGGVKVLSVVEIGSEGSKVWEQSTVSRIKFSIPIIPPAYRTRRSP